MLNKTGSVYVNTTTTRLKDRKLTFQYFFSLTKFISYIFEMQFFIVFNSIKSLSHLAHLELRTFIGKQLKTQ